MRSLEVVATGPLATVQDLGRPGLAALGVGRSGAADRTSYRLANRLVGNSEAAAALEVTLGGLELVAHASVTVALTGAPCPLRIGDRQTAAYAVEQVRAGEVVALGVPPAGMRSYLAVRGGIEVPAVLGSRATDTLAGLGPEPLRPGAVLSVGAPPARYPTVDQAPAALLDGGELDLRVLRGPRHDWFAGHAVPTLVSQPYDVTADSDRIGMRLAGPRLERSHHGELPPEAMVPGALQVPPSGQPTLFLADHPVTGGYPVIAVVLNADIDLAAQARPGQRLRFRLVGDAPSAH